MDASIDWLSFTVPFDRLATVLQFIPGGVTWVGRGWLGYSDLGIFGETGRLGVSRDRPDMGVHAALGHKALSVLAGLDEFWADLRGVVSWVHALGGKVTRLDVAFDDRAGVLDLDTMSEHVRKGWLTSRWRKARRSEGFDLGETGREGYTLEFGRRVSDAFLRCYDKRLERLNAGEDDPGAWLRVELELKRERADAAAELYKSGDERGFFRFISSVLLGYLEFKRPSLTDTNKRRWPVAAWWAAFLGTVEKARLTVLEKVRRTVDTVRAWVAHQVAPNLAVVREALGKAEFMAWVDAEAKAGKRRWKARHRAVLAASGVG